MEMHTKMSESQPKNWQSIKKEILFSRNDARDLRWGDFSTISSPIETRELNHPQNPPIGLWGYCDDQGIAINGGRVGAAIAPDFIRKYFYKITPQTQNFSPFEFSSPALKTFISDYGNWLPAASLTDYVQTISPLLAEKLSHQTMITLGGGHDFGAVDGAGFLQWCQLKQNSSPKSSHYVKPLIINLDAHLDVRPWENGLHSGTPFSWLLDHYQDQFEFIEVGIQNQCSSPHHHQWLKERNVTVIDNDLINKVGLLPLLRERLAGTSQAQDCFLSLDIDVFSQAQAPGCSQSWVGGMSYEEIKMSLEWLYNNKCVSLLGIYEVSPPVDIDHRTSKLAAMIINDFLKTKINKTYLRR